MISIIIPVFNQANLLDRCLVSLRNQIYDNYEIIIIDDGSTDNLDEVIKKYRQIFGHKLTYSYQENQGANAARMAGATKAHGEYLIFCDADVELRSFMLKIMLETLKTDTDASFCYCSFKWGWKTFTLWPYDPERLKQMPYIHTTSLIRAEHFPGFDLNIKKLQDWDLWLTMMEKGQTGIFINKILFKVNTKGSQTMSGWLPSLAYKILSGLPKVKKYNQAVNIIKMKHNLL